MSMASHCQSLQKGDAHARAAVTFVGRAASHTVGRCLHATRLKCGAAVLLLHTGLENKSIPRALIQQLKLPAADRQGVGGFMSCLIFLLLMRKAHT